MWCIVNSNICSASPQLQRSDPIATATYAFRSRHFHLDATINLLLPASVAAIEVYHGWGEKWQGGANNLNRFALYPCVKCVLRHVTPAGW